MQVQPGFDRNIASTQRVGLPPFEPGDRADLDAGDLSVRKLRGARGPPRRDAS